MPSRGDNGEHCGVAIWILDRSSVADGISESSQHRQLDNITFVRPNPIAPDILAGNSLFSSKKEANRCKHTA